MFQETKPESKDGSFSFKTLELCFICIPIELNASYCLLQAMQLEFGLWEVLDHLHSLFANNFLYYNVLSYVQILSENCVIEFP